MAVRRSGLSSIQLKECIETCDVESLPGENVALLLKYMPTKNEVCNQLHNIIHTSNYNRANCVAV